MIVLSVHPMGGHQALPRILILMRKLSYRKDDLAMRHIYGCPENFRYSLSTPTATFLEIFNELLNGWTV